MPGAILSARDKATETTKVCGSCCHGAWNLLHKAEPRQGSGAQGRGKRQGSAGEGRAEQGAEREEELFQKAVKPGPASCIELPWTSASQESTGSLQRERNLWAVITDRSLTAP